MNRLQIQHPVRRSQWTASWTDCKYNIQSGDHSRQHQDVVSASSRGRQPQVSPPGRCCHWLWVLCCADPGSSSTHQSVTSWELVACGSSRNPSPGRSGFRRYIKHCCCWLRCLESSLNPLLRTSGFSALLWPLAVDWAQCTKKQTNIWIPPLHKRLFLLLCDFFAFESAPNPLLRTSGFRHYIKKQKKKKTTVLVSVGLRYLWVTTESFAMYIWIPPRTDSSATRKKLLLLL